MMALTEGSPAVKESILDSRRVLIVSDHLVLGKAIEAGVRSLAHIDILHTQAQPTTILDEIDQCERPDLVILTQLSTGGERRFAVEEALRSLDRYRTVPILLICEEPATPVLGDAMVHYLGFPFNINTLRDKVVEMLRDDAPCSGFAEATPPRARILIVEDERIVAADLQASLESLGYDVVSTLPSAEDAVEFVRQDAPDLVLMDIRLEGEMDGIAATEIIQLETDVPVVFLTAHADAATLEGAKKTAPYGYVLKPFEERELHSVVQMALYRSEAERSIRERECWLRAVLNSIGEGVIATDAAGRIAFANPVAGKLIGYASDEVINHQLSQVYCKAPGDEPSTNPSETPTVCYESRLHTRGGREIIVDETRTPIHNGHGEPWGEILAFRDVTERVRSRELLQQRAAELTAQNEELTAFAYTVAHDIKDPLNIVYGFAALLTEDDCGADEATVREGLHAIADFSRRISNIVDELLLLASVRDADLLPEPLDMSKIVLRAEGRLQYMLKHYRARITHVIDDWPVAVGQPSWVEEVWVNYLSNGIKHGGEPPSLELGADSIDGQVRFWVRDNGVGIDPSDVDKLFVPFSRLHQVRATGQGLGLSIVHRIVSRLGGKVGVESVPGQGSTFYFTLPVWTGKAGPSGGADTDLSPDPDLARGRDVRQPIGETSEQR